MSADVYFFSYVNFIGYYLFVVMCLYERSYKLLVGRSFVVCRKSGFIRVLIFMFNDFLYYSIFLVSLTPVKTVLGWTHPWLHRSVGSGEVCGSVLLQQRQHFTCALTRSSSSWPVPASTRDCINNVRALLYRGYRFLLTTKTFTSISLSVDQFTEIGLLDNQRNGCTGGL